MFRFETLAVAVGHEGFEGVTLITIEDAIDGIVARYILNLASTEFVFLCQCFGGILREGRDHLMPDMHACLQGT